MVEVPNSLFYYGSDHHPRYTLEGEAVRSASGTLLHGSDGSLYFMHVIVRCTYVQPDGYDILSDTLKLMIGMYVSYHVIFSFVKIEYRF